MDGSKCRQMRKDGEKYPSNFFNCCSFRAYLSNFRFDVFACYQEHTGRKWRSEPEQKRTETRRRRQTAKRKRMRSDSRSNLPKFCSSSLSILCIHIAFISLRLTEMGVLFFACPRERTEQEEVERGAPNTVEGRY